MALDDYANYATSTVATAPSTPTAGTSLVVASGDGALFATPPFNAILFHPGDKQPYAPTSEIVRVTNISTDTFTIIRSQEGSVNISIGVGDIIFAGLTKKFITDLNALLNAKADDSAVVHKTGNETIAGNKTFNGTIQGSNLSGSNTGDQTLAGLGGIPTSQKGANNGVAELDSGGLVPSSQLPAYVDDVIEVANYASLPATGESGKIYVTDDTNITYRWSGSTYIEISASLALGETTSTAYRGDRGKVAYDHSQLTSGNPHNVSKNDVGLGNVDNTSDSTKNAATASLTNKNLASGNTFPTFNQNTTGNAGTATKLATPRTINGVNFDGSAAITIPGLVWQAQATSVTATVNKGYITTGASLVTITTPATAAVGTLIQIAGSGAGGWKIKTPAGDNIKFGNVTTTTGTGGSIESNDVNDAVELICTVANTTWSVISSQGNMVVV